MLYDQQSSTNRNVATLEDYLEALKRYRWLVLAVIALFTFAGWLVVNSRVETYSATARVLLNPTAVGSLDNNRLVAPNLDREAEVLVSDGIATQAVAQLGTGEDPRALRREVIAEFSPDSDTIRVSYSSEDPVRAADVVNGFASSYVEQRNAAQDAFYAENLAQIDAELAALDARSLELAAELGALDEERRTLLENVEALNRSTRLEEIATERNLVVTEQNSDTVERRTLSTRRSTVQSAASSATAPAVLLRQAQPPQSPEGLAGNYIILGFFLFGVAVATIAAFLRSRLDRSVNTAADVERALGTRVLGTIPDLGLRDRLARRPIVMLSPNKGLRSQQARESIRRLRSAVQYISRTDGIESIIITSFQPSEGKSTTAANLAVAVATGGQRVALISADLRRPTVESLVGLDLAPTGLSNGLAGDGDLEFLTAPGHDSLFVLPAGPEPANPSELLGSPQFKSVVEEASNSVELMLIDTPPIGSASDALAASQSVDGLIVVVDAKATSTQDLLLLAAELDRSGARLLGAVINRTTPTRRWNLRNRYRYAYESAAAER